MKFFKYSCQGNDFLLFNSLEQAGPSLSPHAVEFLCHRRLGVGADGILLLAPSSSHDFKMIYYNADGHEVEMCGNGARACVDAFCTFKNLSSSDIVNFETMNGLYQGQRHNDSTVSVSMNEVSSIDESYIKNLEPLMQADSSYFISVGVPHALFEVKSTKDVRLQELAPKVRYDKRFAKGTNVSVFEFVSEHEMRLRTYERGVEGETLACGTAATALACVSKEIFKRSMPQKIWLEGGPVSIEHHNGSYKLRASVALIYEGVLTKASQHRLRELQ